LRLIEEFKKKQRFNNRVKELKANKVSKQDYIRFSQVFLVKGGVRARDKNIFN